MVKDIGILMNVIDCAKDTNKPILKTHEALSNKDMKEARCWSNNKGKQSNVFSWHSKIICPTRSTDKIIFFKQTVLMELTSLTNLVIHCIIVIISWETLDSNLKTHECTMASKHIWTLKSHLQILQRKDAVLPFSAIAFFHKTVSKQFLFWIHLIELFINIQIHNIRHFLINHSFLFKTITNLLFVVLCFAWFNLAMAV